MYFRYLSVHLGLTLRFLEYHGLLAARPEDATCGAGGGPQHSLALSLRKSGARASVFEIERGTGKMFNCGRR